MDPEGRLHPAGNATILGIESSCDETAAAVVRNGREVLSNVVASQMALHANWGGVVPELASREHLRNIVPVVREAVARAGLTLFQLDAIAVTHGPGLAGALLVGITYAKALALGLDKPLLAINHLEGHIHAVLMQADMPSPLVALVVSGGHTHLYLAHQTAGAWSYRNIGRTVDDAAGEAFDKVAKLLGLGYPGGPWIDALAGHGDPSAIPFRFGEIKRRGAEPAAPALDFSFSGIKTAVLRYVETHGLRPAAEARRAAFAADPNLTPASALTLAPHLFDRPTLDLIASFQSAVIGNLLRQTFRAVESTHARAILVTGGVAANSELRRRFTAEAERHALPVAFPTLAMSTDNAAMIAAAAFSSLRAHDLAPANLAATPQLRLG